MSSCEGGVRERGRWPHRQKPPAHFRKHKTSTQPRSRTPTPPYQHHNSAPKHHIARQQPLNQQPQHESNAQPQNNSGYYAITDEAAAIDKLTSLKATELFKKINLKPIIPPDLRAKRTVFIHQLDSSIGKLSPEEITREIKTQQTWEKILEETGYSQKKKTKKITTKKNNRTYLDIAKPAIQQTNQPTPALTLSSNTHTKLAALVIEAHIASLAKTESYRSILSKSLKRNFNIDISFPDRDSQKIFNLFINPTTNLEPAPFATPKTNTETVPTHYDMESEKSSTETNDTQDENSSDTKPEQPWETRPKKKTIKKRKKACSPPDNHSSPDTCELKATLVKSATRQPLIPTHPTNEWVLTELSKSHKIIKIEIGKGDPNEVWKQISVNKIHLNQLPIYAIA
ncbi:hypothetical protein FHG87_010004 [Trinorchestia longiramus]|nr:hypothetical protein FHG87_010004 [Trinorchestia longiramus]